MSLHSKLSKNTRKTLHYEGKLAEIINKRIRTIELEIIGNMYKERKQ